MNGELIKTGLAIVLHPDQLRKVASVSQTGLTSRQELLKSSLTASQLVDEWSGTPAQLNCDIGLDIAADAEEIPTLADDNRVFGNSTSVRIIVGHLQSVFRYAGIELPAPQLAETALSILSSYWYLNLAELCIFFSQLKNGSRGQFVWGSKINNQAIMVALADFCKDRRREIERKESDKIRKEIEKGYSRSETLVKDIVVGVQNARAACEEAKRHFDAFLKFFPYLPEKYEPEVLWKAWKGDNDALHTIYGEKIPAANVAEMDIGMYLCNYNIAKGKELEK